MSAIKRSLSFFSADRALGAFGGGLAAASLGFGVYMNIHGPAASFGHSHDFTVFAQLTGPRTPKNPHAPTAESPGPSDALDMTATASISKISSSTAPNAETGSETRIISSVKLQAVSDNAATIIVDGRPQTVRIGDTLPNGGLVLEIRSDPRPSIKTSLGLIVASAPDQ